MKATRIIVSAFVATALTVSVTGSKVDSPAEATAPIQEIRATFVAQDTQKEQDIINEAVQRIEAERLAAKREQERKEAERIAAEEAEAARVAAENARIEAERVVAAEEEAERVRIEAEKVAAQEAENARIEADRLRKEAEQVAQTPVAPAPAPAPAQSGEAWIQETMAAYGVFAAPGTIFLVTDVDNCGGPGGGCTTGLADSATKLWAGPVTIRISPSGIGNPHLLFHEIAHSHNVVDECEAERWAQNVTKNYGVFAYGHCF